MANQDAWQAGIDIAQGKKSKKKNGDSTADDTGSSKPTGGLLGLASKGIQKLRGKGRQAPAGAGATTTSALIPGENIPVFKRGGRVKRTGLIYAHRGEHVIPAKHRKVSRKHTVVKR